MIANRKSQLLLKVILDILILNLSFVGSAALAQSFSILESRPNMFILQLILNLLWLFSTNVTGFYESYNLTTYSYKAVIIVKNSVTQMLVSVFFIFILKEDLFTRNFILFYFIFLNLSVLARTYVFRYAQHSLQKRGKNLKRLLIIGENQIGVDYLNMINHNPDFGFTFVGFVDYTKENNNVIGLVENLDEILHSQKIDEVVVAIPHITPEKLNRIISLCNKNAVRVHIIPDYFQFLSRKFSVINVAGFPIITVREEPLCEFHWRLLKRTFDILFTLLLFVLLFTWLIPIICLVIKLTSKGSVFFVQDRVGLKNEKFRCYKFRSMRNDLDKSKTFVVTSKDDPRITKIGKFLRKSNLDELPQFWNVLKGEMSVVGPRPHAVAYNEEYLQYFEAIKMRHTVKPGLTGWAQVHGLRGDVEDFEENKMRTIKRIEFDLWYIENWSISLDFQIIVLTVWQMLTGNTKGY
ncbi:MAG: undecaprenyl-phosphate glucose phosphotransferase [Bacteroidota bacterium]